MTEDFNKPGGREGAGYYHFAVRDGVRDSAARAMLGDIMMGRDVRTNLDILTGAHVKKVVVEAAPVRRSSRSMFRRVSLFPTFQLAHSTPANVFVAPSRMIGRRSVAVAWVALCRTQIYLSRVTRCEKCAVSKRKD